MAFRAASSATGDSPQDPGKPLGTLGDDILIAIVETQDATETAPAGWTAIRRDASLATSSLASFWALGSVVSTAFSWTGIVTGSVHIQAFSGRDTTLPISVHGGQVDDAATIITAPSVTAAAGDDAVAAWLADDPEAHGAISDIAYTERTNLLTLAGARASTGSADALAAGLTGAKTRSSMPTASVTVGQHIAIKAAAGAASRQQSLTLTGVGV